MGFNYENSAARRNPSRSLPTEPPHSFGKTLPLIRKSLVFAEPTLQRGSNVFRGPDKPPEPQGEMIFLASSVRGQCGRKCVGSIR